MRLYIYVFTVIFTARSLSAQGPTVPALYQDLYNNMTTQIAGFNAVVNAGWNGSSYPYLDAPQLGAAGSPQYTQLLGQYYYSYAVIPQLDELKALGANAVTIHIDFPAFYQPFYTYIGQPAQYQQFVTFYQQLAQDIRSRGLKLVVEATNPMPLAGNQFSVYQTYFSTLSWSQYMTGRAANALAVAQLISPDYMTVLGEPDTEATATGQTTVDSVTGATQLVQQVLTTLQLAGVKNVQIGAGAGTWIKNFMQYIQSFASLPLNYVDIHVYPINKAYFTNALTAADTIHTAGKQVGMSELWNYKIRDSELGVLPYATVMARDPFSFWEPIDVSFLQAIVNFAKYKQLAFISPFWTTYFFSYLDYNIFGLLPVDTILSDSYSAASNAILAGAFTPTGHAWETQNIARDTTPPATPAAPTTSAIGTTTLNLQWAPAIDNVGVSAYHLYRNGSLLNTTSLPLYYDNGLVSGATYTYKLTATDASGNVSAMSAPLVVQTINITPPSVPTNLVVTKVVPGVPGSITLSWKLSTGIGGVGGYRVLRGTSPTSMVIHADVTAPPYTDPYALPSTTYYYEVESYNPIGVTSGPSNEVTVATPGPPSVPTNLVATKVTSTSVSLNWKLSTGIGGVGGYRVLRGTSPGSMSIHADVTAPPYTDPYARRSTTYYYEVESFSTDGVTSGPSKEVTVTTPAH
jgi:fibronectin type 3 domain-containing protein